jgi:glycosyltransferase involved in cell wall biosynthesis
MGVARQLGITDRITCLGNVEHVEAVLPAADLVFQPSEHESFGLVPLEAMACEVPVLVTASGGITEVVEHGVSGYLCEVGDIDAMARYGVEILSDPARAKEMGRRGRAQAVHKFSPERIVGEYEALYENLILRRPELVGLDRP